MKNFSDYSTQIHQKLTIFLLQSPQQELRKYWQNVGKIMEPNQVLDVARSSVWLIIAMSAPVMLVGLVVGVVIGLLQALTQVQEMTLVFVPKILAVFAALLIFLPLMGALLNDFFIELMARIASFGQGG